ncbi:hypothetical protein GCM10027295_27910 [Pseudaeromonas pectinilytica]
MTNIIIKGYIETMKKALSQLAVGNEKEWSLDEKQTVGGRDAAIESTWKYLRRVCGSNRLQSHLSSISQRITGT